MPRPTIVLLRDDRGIYAVLSDTAALTVLTVSTPERALRDEADTDDECVLPNVDEASCAVLGAPNVNPDYVRAAQRAAGVCD